jgi:serine transporter
MMALLAYPLTHYSHRLLSRFVLVGTGESEDITKVADESFGVKIGLLITVLYFVAIFSILLVYAVSLTNTIEAILTTNLGITPPSRIVLSGIITVGLMLLVNYGEEIIIRAISFLVFPFIACIFALSLYMIPHWTGGVFLAPEPSVMDILKSMLFIIPVMVFSFNHSPIISSMVVAQKREYGADAEEHMNKILLLAHILMVGVALFFVFSCAMTFTEEQLAIANTQNVTILTYMSSVFQNPVLHDFAPIIATIAITKSFLGHYMGTKEGFVGIIRRNAPIQRLPHQFVNYFTLAFIGLTCWVVAIYNPSALGLIDNLSGPILAIILFLMPAYAVKVVPAMKKYAGPSVYFVTVIGLLALGAIFVELI